MGEIVHLRRRPSVISGETRLSPEVAETRMATLRTASAFAAIAVGFSLSLMMPAALALLALELLGLR